MDSVLKTNRWTYTIKDLNRVKIIGRFYENEFSRSILQMRYYSELDSVS